MVPPRRFLLALGIVLCGRFAFGQTVINSTFVGKAPAPNFDHYSNASSWSPAEVPNNTASKQFNVNTGDYPLPIVVDMDATISNLTLNAPEGSVLVSGKTLTVAGTTLLSQNGYLEIRPNAGMPGKFDAGALSRFADHTLSGSYIVGGYQPSGAATLQFNGADIRTFAGQLLELNGTLSAIVDEAGNDAFRNFARLEQTSSLYLNDHSVVTNAPFFNAGYLSLSQTDVPATFTASVMLANFDSPTRTLTGGFFSLYSSNFPAGPAVLRFNGADIVNLGSVLDLYGGSARISDLAGNDGLRNFARILPSGFLGLSSHDLTIPGQFQNDGSVFLRGSTFTINGAFTNFDATSRTLTGGMVELDQDSQLRFSGADIVHNASGIKLSFTSAITDLAGNNALRNFTDNLSAGNFILEFKAQFTAPADFTNAGRVETTSPLPAPPRPSPTPVPSPEGRFVLPAGFRYIQTAGTTVNNGVLTAEHVDIFGGILSGAGIVKGDVFVQNGVIAPEARTSIQGNLTLSSSSHFRFQSDLGALSQVSGKVTLDGALEVDIRSGRFVFRSDVITVLETATPFTGSFANAPNGARITTVDGKGSVVVTYDANAIRVGQYQPEPPPAQLLNLSSRAFLSAATDDAFGDRAVVIGGFIISGVDAKDVVVRGLGPSLSHFGLDPVLADPVLELHASDGSLIVSNDNWRQNEAAIQGAGLAPSDDREAAVRTVLLPGTYTVVIREKNGRGGHGLVEIYDLAQNATSKLANISTRGFTDADHLLIGGLIAGGAGPGTADVVVRALGPALRDFGISNAIDDPTLEVRDSNGAVVGSNDDWSAVYPDPITLSDLTPSNKAESAIYLSLPPGSYTAIVRPKANNGGVALFEVYDLRR